MGLVVTLLVVSSIASWACLLMIMSCVPSNTNDIIDSHQSNIISNRKSVENIAEEIGELRQSIDELRDLEGDVMDLSANVIQLEMKLEKAREALL